MNRLTLFFSGLMVLACCPLLYAEPHITWMGCGISKKAFMETLSNVYSEQKDISFRMAGGGATKGIRLSAQGLSDIGGSCRHRLVGEDDDVVSEESDVEMVLVGWDALVIIVNKKNKIDNLSLLQTKNIFSRKIINWSEVGGEDQPIRLLVRKGKISGVGYMFRLLVMEDKNFDFPRAATRFKSSGPLEKNLESSNRFKYGIAVTGISSARKRDLKILSVDGMFPTKENVASGDYPLFRPLYLVVSKKANENARKFVNYVLSREGQQIISAEGTVNIEEGKALTQRWQFFE